MIYLDNAATTPVAPEVIEAMMEELKHYGNPSSKYYPEAVSAKKRLDQYRQTTADLFNADASNIIFNGGATEGNNHIIKGCFYTFPEKKHFITTNAEHKSVLETMKFLESQGAEVTYLPVSNKCTIDPEDLRNAIKEDTNLVSIFFANNEVGSLNDIETLSTIAHEKGVLFHTDATQAVGKVEIDLKNKYKHVDFLTFSAHKIHGPKGAGAEYIGNNEYGARIKLVPLLNGGDQEFKLRSGTQSMHNIAGVAKACKLLLVSDTSTFEIIKKIEENFVTELAQTFLDKIIFFGDFKHKIPGILSFAILGLNNEMFLANYCNQLSLSTGSACTINEPSFVLKAMGYEQFIHNVLRISFSPTTTLSDILNFSRLLSEYLELFSF